MAGPNSSYAPDRFIGDLDDALMRLSDPKDLMRLADPKDIVTVTVRMLGQYTGVDHCDYAEVEADQEHFVILGDYSKGATDTVTGRYRMSDFGSLEDHAYVVDDIESEPPPGSHIPPYLRSELRSLVSSPGWLSPNGRPAIGPARRSTSSIPWHTDVGNLLSASRRSDV